MASLVELAAGQLLDPGADLFLPTRSGRAGLVGAHGGCDLARVDGSAHRQQQGLLAQCEERPPDARVHLQLLGSGQVRIGDGNDPPDRPDAAGASPREVTIDGPTGEAHCPSPPPPQRPLRSHRPALAHAAAWTQGIGDEPGGGTQRRPALDAGMAHRPAQHKRQPERDENLGATREHAPSPACREQHDRAAEQGHDLCRRERCRQGVAADRARSPGGSAVRACSSCR